MSGQSEEATAFFSTGRFQQTFVCFWQRGGGIDRNAGEPSAVSTAGRVPMPVPSPPRDTRPTIKTVSFRSKRLFPPIFNLIKI